MINICFASDDNYAMPTGTAIASILKNAAKEDELSIYIIESGISQQNKDKILALKSIKDCNIQFVPASNCDFSQYAKVMTCPHITIPTYYRLKVASLFPQLDKILYLDGDLIVRRSLKDLYNEDITGYVCAGVEAIKDEKGKDVYDKLYVNAGVILFNLKKMREENTEEVLANYAAENINEIKYGDQDIINFALEGKIKTIDSKYNIQTCNCYYISDYSLDYTIIHYIGSTKPWIFGSFMPFKSEFFKYLKLTQWHCPSKFWQAASTIKSYVRFFLRRPLFMTRPLFRKSLITGVLFK